MADEFPKPRAGAASEQEMWEQNLKDRKEIKELKKEIERLKVMHLQQLSDCWDNAVVAYDTCLDWGSFLDHSELDDDKFQQAKSDYLSLKSKPS